MEEGWSGYEELVECSTIFQGWWEYSSMRWDESWIILQTYFLKRAKLYSLNEQIVWYKTFISMKSGHGEGEAKERKGAQGMEEVSLLYRLQVKSYFCFAVSPPGSLLSTFILPNGARRCMSWFRIITLFYRNSLRGHNRTWPSWVGLRQKSPLHFLDNVSETWAELQSPPLSHTYGSACVLLLQRALTYTCNRRSYQAKEHLITLDGTQVLPSPFCYITARCPRSHSPRSGFLGAATWSTWKAL